MSTKKEDDLSCEDQSQKEELSLQIPIKSAADEAVEAIASWFLSHTLEYIRLPDLTLEPRLSRSVFRAQGFKAIEEFLSRVGPLDTIFILKLYLALEHKAFNEIKKALLLSQTTEPETLSGQLPPAFIKAATAKLEHRQSEAGRRGASVTNLRLEASKQEAIKRASEKWSQNPTIRKHDMLEDITTHLVFEKLKAPTPDILWAWLNDAEKSGLLVIPATVRKPGRPRKST